MRCWFTRPEAPLHQHWIKRFDPLHWSVGFPRGSIASVRRGSDAHSLEVDAEFLRGGDLVGLIWDSEDRHAHLAHARATEKDYSGTRLTFRWKSQGLMPLDQPNGPTLTIEGRDAAGVARAWYVRLWNYANGTAEDAVVSLDFDALDGGYSLPTEADPVYPRDIDRMFISLVPPDYQEGSSLIRNMPADANLVMSDIICSGAGSVIAIADSWQPQQPLGICTGYDDQYHLPPERLIDAIDRLGYEGSIIHYVGMSHYMALDDDGRVDASRGMNLPARRWHEAFARAAAGLGRSVIFSLSYEILDEFCPEGWKQRAYDGSPALTGYVPPSTLVSPAHDGAIDYLGDIAIEVMSIASNAGLTPRFQIGEPWWWVTPSGEPCLYDAAATAAFGGNPVPIGDLAGPLDNQQLKLLDDAGALLAQSTAAISASARSVVPDLQTHLLVFLPTVLDADMPEAKRANLPAGWAYPAFDRLQLEDYDWVTSGHPASSRREAIALAEQHLGYTASHQHYLAGFVSDPVETREQWKRILAAAGEASERGVEETFIWALPQVMRDALVIMPEEKEDMEAFADVQFPIAIGADASVAPTFSTQVVTSASGYEFRNANWSQARLRFDAGPGIRGDAELEMLLAFFRARRGSAQAFLFADPFDHSSNGMSGTPTALDQALGAGDGVRYSFPLIKTYGEGEQRRITRPRPGSVLVAIDGTPMVSGWTLEAGGIVSFDTPPATGSLVSAGFLFDVPVRFAEDKIEVNRASFLAGEAPSVPLVEVRDHAA